METVAVFLIPHETKPSRAALDHPVDQSRFAGNVFHRNVVTLKQRPARAGMPVHKNRRLSQGADHLQVFPVKQLDSQYPGGFLQGEMGRQFLFRDFLGGNLIDLHGIPGTADLIGKACDKKGAKIMAQEFVLRQKRNTSAPGLGNLVSLRALIIAEFLGLVENRFLRHFRNGAASVEDFGNGVSRQSAGIGYVLHGNPFQRHKYSFRMGI